MPEAVIVSAARSPIGRAFKGSIRDLRPDDLLAQTIGAAIAKVPQVTPALVDDLMVGCGMPGGEQGYNIGRAAAVLLGWDDVPGSTTTRYCASSLQTTRMALHAIRAGEGDVFISAGVECVSRMTKGSSDGLPDTMNARFESARNRTARRSTDGTTWVDPRSTGELPDIYIAMGETAENVAQHCGVTREQQDEYAVLSQARAEAAIASGFYAREITPITLADGTVVAEDDCPRPGTTLEKLAALPPAFRPSGTVTAGNSCPLNDGAAAVVVMSDRKAKELGVEPLARIVATGLGAVSPEIMGLGPIDATRDALRRAGMSVADLDLVELNEAFAAQVIPSADALGIPLDKLNVNGGAIALGHPFGMSGARITATLINGLQAADKEVGLETMCVGGGQGMALLIERLA